MANRDSLAYYKEAGFALCYVHASKCFEYQSYHSLMTSKYGSCTLTYLRVIKFRKAGLKQKKSFPGYEITGWTPISIMNSPDSVSQFAPICNMEILT